MRIPLAAVLLFFPLIPASVSAQQSTSPPAAAPLVSDPQAVSLLQRSLIVQVGTAQVTDVTLTGTARRIAGSDDESGTVALRASAAGGSRIDLNFTTGNRSEIRNPSGIPLADSVPPGVPEPTNPASQPVGAWSGTDGVLHGAPNHNLMTDPAWFFPVFTVANLNASANYALSYIGPETLNGQPVVQISATQPSSDTRPGIAALAQHLTQMDIYLDSATLEPVALSFNTHPDNNALVDIAVSVVFSDYRAVNGVQVPFHVQKYLNGGLVLDVQLSSATFNSGLAESTFAIQ
jgi:hypothetical protein